MTVFPDSSPKALNPAVTFPCTENHPVSPDTDSRIGTDQTAKALSASLLGQAPMVVAGSSADSMPNWLRRVGSEQAASPFGIRHKLASLEGFEKRKLKLGMKDDEHTAGKADLDAADMVRVLPKAVTRNIHDCTAVILNNGKNGTMGHFIPEENNLLKNDIEDALKKDAVELNKQASTAALILGGDSSEPDSVKLKEKIQKAIDSTGLSKSQIWGRKEEINDGGSDDEGEWEWRPRMHAMFDAAKRTNYIAAEGDDELRSLRSLAYWYQKIHIAAPDYFEVQGRLLTA